MLRAQTPSRPASVILSHDHFLLNDKIRPFGHLLAGHPEHDLLLSDVTRFLRIRCILDGNCVPSSAYLKIYWLRKWFCVGRHIENKAGPESGWEMVQPSY